METIGNLATHEAGHYLGSWHTDGFNNVQGLMDEGPGGLFNLIGVNPATGVFGDRGTIDVDFATEEFSTGEFFTGVENTAAVTAFAFTSYPFGGRGKEPLAHSHGITQNAHTHVDHGMLAQNFPNPAQADGVTRIGFRIPSTTNGRVKLSLYDLQGREIANLFSGLAYGNQTYQVDLNAGELGLAKGTYFYRLDTDSGSEQRTLILH